MQEENYSDNENPKLSLMWEMLSEKRQMDINKMITETIGQFWYIGSVEIYKIYPLELTHGFDDDKIHIQYVYLKCAFRFSKVPKNMIMPVIGMPTPEKIIDVRILDVEVFKEDKMFDWLDHVNRINNDREENKDNQLFYEDNIFTKKEELKKEGEELEEGGAEIKQLFSKESSNPKQTNIHKPIENRLNNDGNESKIFHHNFMSDFSNEDVATRFDTGGNKNININNVNKTPHLIPKKQLFDFYSKTEPDKRNDEYLSIFRNYSRSIVNYTMVAYYNHNIEDEINDSPVLSLINALKNLQNNFSNCDFWVFNRHELGQLGFINWSDEILLIPIWAFPVILKNSKDKHVFTHKNDEILIRDINIHENPLVKFGCVPFGFKISQIKE